ncbi:MAG: MaoC family dehydratase [Casimicrobiaceae bacterium]
MKVFQRLADLKPLIGEELATSDWFTITQDQINRFAEATGDHQWIHVDPDRAATGPFGTTIAHGFMTLSLLPMLLSNAIEIRDVKMGVNYGLNRVRFIAPVPVGSELRAHIRLLNYEELPGGAQVTTEVTIERNGERRPVCVAEAISRRYVEPAAGRKRP